MARPPKQKPGQSEQSVGTPVEFLDAVRRRLAIPDFAIDLAAEPHNAVTGLYVTKEIDSLSPELSWNYGPEWGWLNPEYKHITPWVRKAYEQKLEGAYTAVLIPASIGANWWRDWVHEKALVIALNGRITFVGHEDPYPKDLALLLYAEGVGTGYTVWRWQDDDNTDPGPEPGSRGDGIGLWE